MRKACMVNTVAVRERVRKACMVNTCQGKGEEGLHG